jgi:signal transduction histidine kinase/ligand-binding sensor domain-containing protein
MSVIGTSLVTTPTLLASLLFYAAASAQQQRASELADPFLQTVWTTEDGLPQNSVNAIVQTRDGYLWLGTFGGLARFDGVRFTIFNSANTPGLKSNRITALFEDRRGVLWLGTETGELMSLEDGVGTTYSMPGTLQGAIVSPGALTGDSAGVLWAGTSKGLARFQDGKFTAYTTAQGLPTNIIYAVEQDQAGRLWVMAERELVQFDGRHFVPYRFPEGLLEGSFIRRRQGGLWLPATTGVALFVDGKFVSYPHLSRSPWNMRTLFEDREGTLWIASVSPLMVQRFQGGRFSPYAMKSFEYEIRTMYEDREGNLWMGSTGGGLLRLKKRAVSTYTTENGLPSNDVRAVTDDGIGGTWISTSSGLAHVSAGKITVYTDKDGLLSSYATALLRDRAGGLWIGSNRGLTQLKDRRFINYTPAQGLSSPVVMSLAEDRDGNVWIGTMEGLTRLRNGTFTVYNRAAGLVSNDVRSIVEARDGALWVGTTGGLSCFRNGTFANYTTRDGLTNDYVRAIVEEPDGALWVGTYGGGLNRFENGRFTPVTTQDGLFDDFVSRILEDDRGNFWMLGNRGIFSVSRAALNDFAAGRARSITSIAYGIGDGMKSSEGEGNAQPAGWRAADGKLWFPTIKGIAVLDPSPMNTLPSPVVIQGVTVDRVAQSPTHGVEIKPGQQNLEIYYAGLTFSRPEQVKFKYQLVGFDRDWIDAGTRRTAYYPQLPSGNYTFKVIADNGYGVWNMEGQSVSVIVLPPFYQTWWFVTLVSLTVAGMTALIWRQRVSQLQRAHAAQQAFSRQLIASQESERKRIAAELHDSLGQRLVIIKNLALILLNGSAADGAREQIDEISTEASQALGEVKEISYNLRPHQLDRLGLTKTLEALVKKAASASPIAFTSEIDDIDDVFPKQAEINFYRVAQESVSNVVKHSAATEASVTVRREEGRIALTVRDNGRGFVPETTQPSPDAAGFGLVGISERATLLGGHATIESEPGRGTTIAISIDLQRAPDVH